MYIDEVHIRTLGTKYEKNKEKKNQVVNHFANDDGMQAKDLIQFLETYQDNIAKHTDCEILVTFKERN